MNRGKGRGTGGMAREPIQPDGRSGAIQRAAEVPGSSLGRIDVHLDPGAELEPGADGESRHQVDVPTEVVGPAGSGANPQVQLRRGPEEGGERSERGADHRRSDLAVPLELGHRTARNHAELEWGPGSPRTDQKRLVVDRHEPL